MYSPRLLILSDYQDKSPRLTPQEADWLSRVSFELHDHTARLPQPAMWWERVDESLLSRRMH